MTKPVILPYSELTVNDLHDMLALRAAVFVVEQNCVYQDIDGKDKKAFHLIARTEVGKLVGTLRILEPGVSYSEVSIGRVASHPDHRHEKLGHLMMKTAMEFITATWKNENVRISAQSHLCDFYSKYDFKKTGKEYLEDDIPHAEMLYTATTS